MKFLLDDNIPYSIKNFLEKQGMEVYKLFEIGLKGEEDEKIYKYSIEKNFTIITLDIDFGYLFFKFGKGNVILLRPKKAIPKDMIDMLAKSLNIIKKEKGLIIVKPGRVKVIRL